jgi:glycosyltransferase involved in cell wall biosynthesis
MCANTATVPRVSVIMPVFGTAPFVPAALDSVFAQTYKDYEIIVVNDGSPDTPLLEQALAPYRTRITYILQENRGSSSARNTAIMAARGDYVAILDSDDYWHPEYLQSQLAVLDANPTIDVVYPDAIWFSADGKRTTQFSHEHPVGGEISFWSVLSRACQIYGGATGRRETIIRAGLYDEQLKTGEDFDLWLRILKAGGRIQYNNRVLAYYRERPGSLTSDRLSLVRNIVEVLDRLEQRVDLTPDERALLRRQRSNAAASLRLLEGKRALLNGDRNAALATFSSAFSHTRSWKLKAAIVSLKLVPGLLFQLYRLRERWHRPT